VNLCLNGCFNVFVLLLPVFMQTINLLYPLLTAGNKQVVITMHQKPDGDAMGSSLGLYHVLIQLGHQVTVVSPTNWASFLNWMPGCDLVLDFEKSIHKDKALAAIENADWRKDFNRSPSTPTN